MLKGITYCLLYLYRCYICQDSRCILWVSPAPPNESGGYRRIDVVYAFQLACFIDVTFQFNSHFCQISQRRTYLHKNCRWSFKCKAILPGNPVIRALHLLDYQIVKEPKTKTAHNKKKPMLYSTDFPEK